MVWRTNMRRIGVKLGLAAIAIAGLIGTNPFGPPPVRAQQISPNPPGNQIADWVASDDDSWLLDLRSGKYQLGQGVRGYQTSSGLCVDLGDMILALDLPISLDKKSRRATGWTFSERQTLVIDRDAGRVDYSGRTTVLTPKMIHDTPEGWCVAIDALSVWLGLVLKPDLSNAILTIESSTKLPFEVQAERRARAASIKPAAMLGRSGGRFDLDSLQGIIQPYASWTMPSVDVVATTSFTKDQRVANGGFGSGSNGGVIGGNAGGQKTLLRYEIFAAGEAGKLSYDARLASDDQGIPATLRVRAFRSDPDGGLLGPLHATHIAVGDVSGFSTALVTQPSIGRGFVVTNRPLEQPDSYDRTSFRGDLPAGWDAELYRNGQLLAFSTISDTGGVENSGSGGRYQFLDVPLLYGNNRFEIVLYGPQGQIRRETKIVPVGVESLPPNKTWFWAGVLDEGKDLLRIRTFDRPVGRGLRGTFGLEHGIGPKTAIMAQYHNLLIDNRRFHYGETALRQAMGPFLADVSLAYAQQIGASLPGNAGLSRSGYALRSQILGEIGQTYIRAETTWAAKGFESDRIARGVRQYHSLSIDQTLKLAGSILPVHLEARYIGRVSGANSVETGARMSTMFRNLSLTAQLDWRHQTSGYSGGESNDDVQLSLLANARVGRVRLRGEALLALAGRSQSNRFNMIAEWGDGGDLRTHSADGGAQWRGEIGYDDGVKRARAALSYVRHFKPVSAALTGEVASDGSIGLGLNVAFSLGPNPRNGGLRVTSTKLASQGQVLASVWRDMNADGIWQADEPAEPGVGITAGTSIADDPTGADGKTIIDNVTPFRKILIGVDSGTLTDPLIQPAQAGFVVTPRPGVITRINLPIVPSGEVEGLLVRGGGRTLQGVDLELVDTSGRVRGTTRSDYDGYFLFESVPYGDYALRVATLSAQLARLKTDLGRRVILNGDRPRVQIGTISVDTDANAAVNTIAAVKPAAAPLRATPPAAVAVPALENPDNAPLPVSGSANRVGQRGKSFIYMQ